MNDAGIGEIHRLVAEYYSGKLKVHGPTPAGVDWRDAEGQELRFRKLLNIVQQPALGASLAELGCGYGALARYMRRSGLAISYTGYDVAPDMVAAARALDGNLPDVAFHEGSEISEAADYCVASGIFNVRMDKSDAVWRHYVDETLGAMARSARRGFAANFLTRWSDPHRMSSRLYYADPGEMLNECIRRFGRHVSIAHGYSLYEFTVLVWHEGEAPQ